MFNEKQKLESGNDSTNYQSAGDITVNQQGLSYTEVKDVAMMIFKTNFVDLGEQVDQIVNERAETIINDYLEKLRKENPQAILNTIDPDVRYGIYEAQKSYARSGREDTEKLLVDLLYERTVTSNNEMRRIILNEALDVASKMTKLHLDLLSISFLGRIVNFTNKVNPENFIDLISPFAYVFELNKDKYTDYYYLTSLGCSEISIGSVDFDNAISGKNLLNLETEQEIRQQIINYPILNKMKIFWDNPNRKMQNMTTTPIGSTLAIVNINRTLGYKAIPLELAF